MRVLGFFETVPYVSSPSRLLHLNILITLNKLLFRCMGLTMNIRAKLALDGWLSSPALELGKSFPLMVWKVLMNVSLSGRGGVLDSLQV